ncbi:MAG: trypsin-like peptidase domain-containing protein, partial [Nitrospiraceae bacterium]
SLLLSACFAKEEELAKVKQSLDDQIVTLGEQGKGLEGQVSDVDQKVDQQNRELSARISEGRDENERLQKETAKLNEQIANLRDQDLPALHDQIDKISSRLDAVISPEEAQAIRDDLAHYAERAEQGQARLNVFEDKTIDWQNAMVMVQSDQADQMRQDREQFSQELQTVDASISALANTLDGRLQDQTLAMNEAEERNRALMMEQMAELQATLAEFKHGLNQLNTKLFREEQRVNDLTTRLQAVIILPGEGDQQSKRAEEEADFLLRGEEKRVPEQERAIVTSPASPKSPETQLRRGERPVLPLNVSEIAQRYTGSVVTILALDKDDQPLTVGSGFFINNEGQIATNYHVLEGSAKAIVKTIDGQRGEVLEIISLNPELDLLVATTTLTNASSLRFGNSESVTVGEDIVVIGNPEGLEGTISKGIISGVRQVGDLKLLQITAPISPGSSGGPVFNLWGEVVGIATLYLGKGQNLNFAMPVNYIQTLKPTQYALKDLPRRTLKTSVDEKQQARVTVFDLVCGSGDTTSNGCEQFVQDSTSRIFFGLKNDTNYPINHIKVFFIYKNRSGEVISYSAKLVRETILPKLALQFEHTHSVRNMKGGMVEVRILDYKIDRSAPSSPAEILFN